MRFGAVVWLIVCRHIVSIYTAYCPHLRHIVSIYDKLSAYTAYIVSIYTANCQHLRHIVRIYGTLSVYTAYCQYIRCNVSIYDILSVYTVYCQYIRHIVSKYGILSVYTTCFSIYGMLRRQKEARIEKPRRVKNSKTTRNLHSLFQTRKYPIFQCCVQTTIYRKLDMLIRRLQGALQTL